MHTRKHEETDKTSSSNTMSSDGIDKDNTPVPSSYDGDRSGTATTSTTTSNNNNKLRVDCYPREYTDMVCLMLQNQARKFVVDKNINNTNHGCPSNFKYMQNDNDDPYEGYIPMTMSRSKCTHRLVIILLLQNDSVKHTTSAESTVPPDTLQESLVCYWGIEQQQEQEGKEQQPTVNELMTHLQHRQPQTEESLIHTSRGPTRSTTTTPSHTISSTLSIKLNHQAAEEIIVVPDEYLLQQFYQKQKQPTTNDGSSNGVKIVHQPRKKHKPTSDVNNNNTKDSDGIQLPTSTMTTTKIGSSVDIDDQLPKTFSNVVPLSRAYYKLEQVYYDYVYDDWIDSLEKIKMNIRQQMSTGDSKQNFVVGLDVGASPGGWTQVLLNTFSGIEHVVAIDKAELGQRLFVDTGTENSATCPKNALLTHVKSTIENAYETSLKNLSYRYSILVCDASIYWAESLQLLHTLIIDKVLWTVPAFFVITLKLPCKTIGSIQRHVQLLDKKIPTFVQSIVDSVQRSTAVIKASTSLSKQASDDVLISPIIGRYQLVHLMANSDSERTLVVIVE